MAACAPVALATWPELTDGLWAHFTDNSGAEASLAKGSSKAQGLNEIAAYTWHHAATRPLSLWTARVATGDNPTDGLSRGSLDGFTSEWHFVAARLPNLSFAPEA